ncbi:MAG: hypothetical protein ACFFAH_11585 [Promethearchaeota archaeon]
MRQIKGSLLKYFIKNIRANKSGIYDEILTEEEKEIINLRILDSVWYPYEYFKKLLSAVVKVEANGDMTTVAKWGYDHGKRTLDQIHKGRREKRPLPLAIASYDQLFKLWFDFGKQYGEIISENEINIVIEEFDEDFDLFYYIGSGWIRSFFENYLDTKIQLKFLQKSWEGDDKTILNLNWNS